MTRERWDVELAVRERERQAVMATAADEVGELTPRELELVAVAAYWCEGAKSKPWRRTEFVKFVNSDPDLIRLFLSWLRHVGVPDHHLSPAVSIHESADVAAATAFWSEVTGIAVERFGKTSLKRHTPRTVRKNVGEDYRGCLTIGVRQSRELYQRLAGTWRGIALGAQSVLPDGAD